MADQQTRTADVDVERTDEYEQHGMEAINAVVVNPLGEHPTEILDAATDAVREKWSRDDIPDGGRRTVGEVEYTADDVVSVSVDGPDGG